MERENYSAYSLADFLICWGYFQAYLWRRRAKGVCSVSLLSFAEGHWILIKLKQRQGCVCVGGGVLLKLLSDLLLLGAQTFVCVCTHPTSMESLSIPQLSFSHSSWHDSYATHIWRVFPFTAGERCLGFGW